MNGALLSFVRSRSRISRIQIIGTEIKKNLFKVVGNTLNLDRPSLDLITDIRFQFDDQIDQTPKIVIYAGSTHFMKIPNYCIEIRGNTVYCFLDLYLRNFGMIYDYFTVEIDSKTEAQLCTFSGLSINDLKFRNKFTLVMDHHSYGHIYKSGCSFEEGKEYWNFAWNGNGMVLSCFGQYSNFFCPNNLRELDKKVDKKFRKYYHNLPNLVDQ